MDYDCHVVPVDKLTVTARGVAEPLCNSCLSPDCTNPIREQTVSVCGIPKKMRFWTVNRQIRQVVACRGYVGNAEVSESKLPPRTPTIIIREGTSTSGMRAEGQQGDAEQLDDEAFLRGVPEGESILHKEVP